MLLFPTHLYPSLSFFSFSPPQCLVIQLILHSLTFLLPISPFPLSFHVHLLMDQGKEVYLIKFVLAILMMMNRNSFWVTYTYWLDWEEEKLGQEAKNEEGKEQVWTFGIKWIEDGNGLHVYLQLFWKVRTAIPSNESYMLLFAYLSQTQHNSWGTVARKCMIIASNDTNTQLLAMGLILFFVNEWESREWVLVLKRHDFGLKDVSFRFNPRKLYFCFLVGHPNWWEKILMVINFD